MPRFLQLCGLAFVAAIVWFAASSFCGPRRDRIETTVVSGDAMAPALVDGETIRVHVDGQPAAQDIVLYKSPLDSTRTFVGRVAALPGQTILIASGTVLVDGKELDEPYVRQAYKTSTTETHLASGEYFVLGDNRELSYDSRSFGPVDEDNILGVVISP